MSLSGNTEFEYVERYVVLPPSAAQQAHTWKMEQRVIDRLAQGLTIRGVEYGPIKVEIITRRSSEEHSTNQWISVSLTEGKNREIRRVFEHFKLAITRLIRVQYGYGSPQCIVSIYSFFSFSRPFKLDSKLEPGTHRHESCSLYEFLTSLFLLLKVTSLKRKYNQIL